MAKDTNEMPTTDTLELPPMEEGFVHFYWTDIYEDQHHAPGRLYLFGKVVSVVFFHFISLFKFSVLFLFIFHLSNRFLIQKRTAILVAPSL